MPRGQAEFRQPLQQCIDWRFPLPSAPVLRRQSSALARRTSDGDFGRGSGRAISVRKLSIVPVSRGDSAEYLRALRDRRAGQVDDFSRIPIGGCLNQTADDLGLVAQQSEPLKLHLIKSAITTEPCILRVKRLRRDSRVICSPDSTCTASPAAICRIGSSREHRQRHPHPPPLRAPKISLHPSPRPGSKSPDRVTRDINRGTA